jgi:RNA polymerase sigma-70 factor (ECF subfamily)
MTFADARHDANRARDARVERLFHEHAEAVRGRVRRVDPALADDVVSETFATALRRHDVIPAGAERAWLFVVADHLLRNQQRSRRRATALTDALRPHARTTQAPAEPPAVGAALAALPDRERALLTMTGLEGLSATEAADRLGISSGTALNTMVRARRQLRVKLAALGVVVASLAFGIVFAEGAQARAHQPVVAVTALVRP